MPLRIVVLYDGKPGHLSQSLGLARLIAEHHHQACDIRCIDARPRLKLLNRLLRRWAAGPRRFLLALVPILHRINTRGGLGQRPDLLVSFGGNVLALNIALSRLWQVPNLAIGNCYGVPDRYIRANLTLSGDAHRRNCLATHLPLCRITATACVTAARQQLPGALTTATEAGTRPCWTLLIGGDGSGYHYADTDWLALAQAARTLAQRHGIHWLISTSRRTAPRVANLIGRTLGMAYCAAMVDGRAQSDVSIDALLGAAQRIFCTEDSLSMLTESVAADKAVISLRPGQSTPRPVHAEVLANMAKQGLVERVAIEEMANYAPRAWQPVQSRPAQQADLYRQLQLRGVFQRRRNRLPGRTLHPALPR